MRGREGVAAHDPLSCTRRLTLCARVDAHGGDAAVAGELGAKFKAEVEAKVEKWQEPPPARTKKALPKPDDAPRRKRAGKRCAAHVRPPLPHVAPVTVPRAPWSLTRCQVPQTQGAARDDGDGQGAQPRLLRDLRR